MPYVEAEPEVRLYYEDLCRGERQAATPLVLIHGWPLSASSWEKQVPALLAAGYRTIAYDRRGFGRSDRPAGGHDYDTLAADLDRLIEALDLRGAVLVGSGMGTGECVRYLARHGAARVRAVALLSSIPPFLLLTGDNPRGVDGAVFRRMSEAVERDRYAFAAAFLADCYNVRQLAGVRVSEEAVRASWNVAALASATAFAAAIPAWLTDFRADLAHVAVPALVLHGDDDPILPIAATGLRLHESLPQSRWVVIEGGAHGLLWTHAEEVNRELLAFLGSLPEWSGGRGGELRARPP